jgi:hypothetical protein
MTLASRFKSRQGIKEYPMRRTLILTAFSLVLGCLSACNLPTGQTASGLHAWIDAPLTGSVVAVNANVDVISHSSAPAGINNVELDINSSALRTDAVPGSGQAYVLMKQSWMPTQAGTYQLRVRAQTTGGQWSDYAAVMVTVTDQAAGRPTPSESPTPRGSALPSLNPTLPGSPTPSVTSLPTLTPTLATPVFIFNENTFCRQGPSVIFLDVTAIPKGDTVDIRGVSQDGFWYFVFWKRLNASCWVAASTGQASGDLSGVPVLVSPPTPTSSPTRRPTSRPSPTLGGKP